ncbi:putative protein phosphatase 2C 55 [Sesamum angolense]|uniref:Protein phosphatase n=1 Tax=Sesamum angolense TaxID=2727404 RepID=A0AAE1WCG8_9LAMI|nr:putative protein phosphatase 2C 55 [Sesamum angolense]
MPSNYLSRLHSAVRERVWRSVSGKGGGIEDHIDVLIGQGKVLLGHCRNIHSLPSGPFTDLQVFVRPGTVVAAQANHIANRKKNFSVAGAFSRAMSIPSVSGPSFQLCGYHIDLLLSEPSQGMGIKSEKSLMAVCGSRSALTDYPINQRTSRPAQFECLHILSSACSSAGTACDVSFDNSVREDHLSSSAQSPQLSIPVDRPLKLNSGSCYLPHPDKEETGGEDAHFICTGEHAIGVADGVGGWADVGVDAGKYARELMSNSVNAIQEEPKGSINPTRVLEKAYTSTKAKGSSTACIIALTDQGLHAINLGDSGFMVVRDGCTVFRSPVQQHDFNFTYQLEGGNAGDLPSSGQVFTIPVAPGDVIIAGTDGLFDNLYNNDITAVVVHAVRAGFGPQVTAQKIAALARQRAQDKNRQTPFSTAAQEAGFRYYGGKLDDITVVVSYIASDHNTIGCNAYAGEPFSQQLYLEKQFEMSWFSLSFPSVKCFESSGTMPNFMLAVCKE